MHLQDFKFVRHYRMYVKQYHHNISKFEGPGLSTVTATWFDGGIL